MGAVLGTSPNFLHGAGEEEQGERCLSKFRDFQCPHGGYREYQQEEVQDDVCGQRGHDQSVRIETAALVRSSRLLPEVARRGAAESESKCGCLTTFSKLGLWLPPSLSQTYDPEKKDCGH